ncbi:MAG: DoxX family protein [Candidatus Niyogibacteria bacterium]|nr:DoxX family protein [Candidatus Niyogibacteria bacterium]
MDQYQKYSLFALRIVLGWFFFYAGITKVMDPAWSAAGYLKAAKTFPALYQWFASPDIIPVVNFVNEWGLTLLGISLILGIGVRLSSLLGAVLMLLYYFPILQFPVVAPHAYIVDDHIIFIAALFVLGAFRAGRYWGLEKWCAGLPICRQFPVIRNWVG